MYRADKIKTNKKEEYYRQLNQLLTALIDEEKSMIANLANAAALLFHQLDNINWAGFYLLDRNQLVLGPFQGKPACTRISVGNGVCGKAAAQKKSLNVPDVHAFPGHIACDPASRSEVVIPILHGKELLGVLDIDSPNANRFDDADLRGLEEFVHILEKTMNHGG